MISSAQSWNGCEEPVGWVGPVLGERLILLENPLFPALTDGRCGFAQAEECLVLLGCFLG